jgi:sulfonate dioxygenase
MAPGLVETATEVTHVATKDLKVALKPTGNIHSYVPGRTAVKKHDETYKYEDLRPRFPDITWPALTPVEYHDKGLLGDANFKNLLSSATDVFDYNPKVGTEIHGADLASLTDLQKNDLARLIATRGVVFFRDQKNFGIDEQRALGKYFGELHSHATTAMPRREGLEDVHVVYTGENSPDLRALFTPTFLWHSDVSSLISNLYPYQKLTQDRSLTKSNHHPTVAARPSGPPSMPPTTCSRPTCRSILSLSPPSTLLSSKRRARAI